MNAPHVVQLQRVLESLRDETLASITRGEKEGRALGEDVPRDEGESSVSNLSREYLFQQGTRRWRVVRNIEAALDRMRKGTFGTCVRCGDEIKPKRLLALPFTAFCRDCQENIEREAVPEPYQV
jgi:DnaK suppressor protein